MSTEKTANAGGDYGYSDYVGGGVSFNFGLVANVTHMTKFEWINNAGKDGAEQEALDIVFNINDVDKSYRLFPVTKAFGKNNVEITDPASKEMKEARQDFNAKVTHILTAFVSDSIIKQALNRPFSSFKEFVQAATAVLPKDFASKSVDVFMQYQWTISSGKDRTYLELPKSMKYGKWIVASSGETWKETRLVEPSDLVKEALYYTTEAGLKHDFVRTGWFVNSKFAKQERDETAEANDAEAAAAASTDAPASTDATAAPTAGKTAAAW